MNSYSPQQTVTSFSNIAFDPDDDSPPPSSSEGSSHTQRGEEDKCSARRNRLFNNKIRRPLLTSTPRVVFRKCSGNNIVQFFSNETPFQPMNDVVEMNDSLDLSENSQGYRFFNDKLSFPLRSTNHRFLLDFSKLTSLPRRIYDSISDGFLNFRTPSPNFVINDGYEGSLEVEQARDDNREHIDLSEIFSSSSERNRGSRRNRIFPTESVNLEEATNKNRNEMGSLHRSEEMKLYQMILVKEAAYECLAEIGKHGNAQFVDLNSKQSMYTRTFVKQMRRSEEMERKLRFLEKQVITCSPEIEPKSIDFSSLHAPTQAEVMQLELRLDQLEKEFVDLNHNDTQLRRNLNSAREFYQCLSMVDDFFNVHKGEDTKAKLERSATGDELEIFSKSFAFGGLPSSNDVPLTPLLQPDEENAWFVAGVLPWDKKSSFERVLWRACRRTAFVNTSDSYFLINDPVTLEPNQKCVFIVFFKGDSLRQIVEKVCDGFNATQYPCPKISKDRKMKMAEAENRMKDLTIVIDTTQTHRYTILKDLSYQLPDWMKSIQIQKSVYHVMNMFTVDTNGFLAGECWIPTTEETNVRKAMNEGFEKSGTQVEPILNEIFSSAVPPTLHKTNKFTQVFQSIVDSYGVSQYREINPAPYTIITFPFFFAMMFGDAAHGLILLLFSLFLILNESKIEKAKIRDEIFNTFFGGRYIIMLMGIFSIYTGFLYNDAFAKSMNLFGSSWKNSYNTTVLEKLTDRSYRRHREYFLELVPELAFEKENGPYLFGVDPIWNIAENRLVFLNSMKMKASIIFGIAQMTFGVFLSSLNHIHFKSYIDIVTNFIPQVIFLSALFIYLCVQIVLKWVYISVFSGNVLGYEYPGPNCAPSLLIGLINMFMFKQRNEGYIDKNGENYPNCHLGYWYPNQRTVETILIITALCCIPIMLLGKPLWLKFVNSRRLKKQRTVEKRPSMVPKNNGNSAGNGQEPLALLDDVEFSMPDGLDIEEDIHHSMTDIFVHQAIHTIEFVLGCVSHTASYLRLWALSLAHAQLSEVMWHMVLMQGLHLAEQVPSNVAAVLGPVVVAVTFLIFAVLSLSILIMMEGLSAFLHALRLHWVEFQSKFYVGTGHQFHAFHLKENLENAQLVTEETDRIADITRTA